MINATNFVCGLKFDIPISTYFCLFYAVNKHVLVEAFAVSEKTTQNFGECSREMLQRPARDEVVTESHSCVNQNPVINGRRRRQFAERLLENILKFHSACTHFKYVIDLR